MRFLYWITIFGFFSFLTISSLVNVIKDYWRYPVITSINLSHKPQVDFPAVTVCNLNMYDFGSSFITLNYIYHILRVHCLNTMDVFLSLHEKKTSLDNSTEEYASTLETLQIIDHVFFDYSGCNFQVKLYKIVSYFMLCFDLLRFRPKQL